MRKMIPTAPLLAGLFLMLTCNAWSLELNPPDLSPLQRIDAASGTPLPLIVAGRLTLPIVIGKKPTDRVAWAAEFLAESIEEMTGNPATVLKQNVVDGPAIYIGVPEALQKAGLSAGGMQPGEFAVKMLAGNIYLFGNDEHSSTGSAYAALDFGERVLGIRQYYEPELGGRSVIPTANLVVPPLDYGDRPIFPKRDLWPYSGKKHLQTWRIADTHPIKLIVHAPTDWGKDQDYRTNRPEIFELNQDGSRGTGPMLCYGNSKTLETYLERIAEELAGKRPSGVMRGKAVTVSPWDKGVNCFCSDCRPLFDESAGESGSASRIVSGFVRRLSDALAKSHPDLTVIYLPYLNYCDIPAGTAFPAANVEVQLCTMPGLAMLKEPSVKSHEEKLIRGWAKVTGRPIQNWHYPCWPAEFTSAPYIYADAIIQHYRDTRDVTSGSFLNGSYPEVRHLLSAYVWMRALWNPALDSQAIFDDFAKRMFGPAAAPMLRVIALQSDGWKRPWAYPKVSPLNIFEVSYPRAEVEEMEARFAEAYQLAGTDERTRKRIDHYRGGFAQFFKESREHADGTAFAPLMIQKVTANPVIDGSLDDSAWKRAEPLSFIRARDREVREPKYPTTVQAVWTADGITFGFRMSEPTPDKLWVAEPAGSWHNDNVELFFDVTGKGAGDFYQIIVDARNEGLDFTHAAAPAGWKPQGIRSDIRRGADHWTAEVFVPFSVFAGLDEAQIPQTSSTGLFWVGNFTRHRKADSKTKDRLPESSTELTRLNTRYSGYSADQSAFGALKFVE